MPPPSEAALLQRVREGSAEAYAVLFAWHHPGLIRAATAIAGPAAAEDLVAEAFARTWALLRVGQGPRVSFRAYVYTSMRAIHVGVLRREARLATTGWPAASPGDRPDQIAATAPERALVATDDAEGRFDRAAVREAFETLPPRWRQVLWLTTVEGRGHAEVAARLNLNPVATRALAFRAREGLRRAFIAQHLQRPDEIGCASALTDLPALVRGTLPDPRTRQLVAHLARCASCADAADEAASVNRLLGSGRRRRDGDTR